VYSRLLGSDRDETRDERRLEAFARELSLSAAQREQVRRIFEQRRPERERRLAAMFESCGQPVIQDREQQNAELRSVLEPEQHAKFDAFIARHRRFGQAPR
jgi:Spy/CpxP family protein refolding chaperone